MMDWQDEGILLAIRPHGESAAIIQVLTAGHGLHAGVVHGGGSRRMAPVLQPGAQLVLHWRARLDQHLGSFAVEPLRERAGALFGDRAALAALASISALLVYALPEREPHPALYAATETLFDRLSAPGWEADYLRWEVTLLAEMGFGLDLGRCAVTGEAEGLAYVSPRTGRAVTRAAAGEWADRLLPRPEALVAGPVDAAGLAAGLLTTGHFMERWLAEELVGRPLPEARRRLVALLSAP
ncbi:MULTISPECIES: DNA repair protein RecO [unclassified Haematobacter]|uniref:DNA repair protein RecO n=1 Tax=unclassified Haematobacter TaxID=2640585 RepID=UPI0025C21D1A|nr:MULTISPECIES: DNA repair protein RecO [unclassified Haematobacter]